MKPFYPDPAKFVQSLYKLSARGELVEIKEEVEEEEERVRIKDKRRKKTMSRRGKEGKGEIIT